jgi:redox-sensitive bicupin YhaK (pirin superfamily)
MNSNRAVAELLHGRRTSDGAGVKLIRFFGDGDVSSLDPFLLLDYFGSDRAEDYMAGFPLHPHRGMETVTYMLEGHIDHRDSVGNHGSIGPGDVQWMTAGSGIMHEEMPRRGEGAMRGFQLWVNLPRAQKMTPPKYRGVRSDQIPEVVAEDVRVKVIAGNVAGTKGPVHELSVPVEYLDVTLEGEAVMEHRIPREWNAFILVFTGSLRVEGPDSSAPVASGTAALLGEGDVFKAVGGQEGARFLLVSGRPIREPIAWGGPIVMNTREELDEAFAEIRAGTFIRKR